MATRDNPQQLIQKCKHETAALVNALLVTTNEEQWTGLLNQVQAATRDSQWGVLYILKSVILKMVSVSSLKNLMQIFIMKISDLITKNGVLENETLSTECLALLKDFWSLCCNQHHAITKQMFGVYSPALFDVLPSLASLYIDLCVTSYKSKEKTELLSRRLYGWLNVDLNERCLKTALLEVSQCSAKTARFLLPILRKTLTPPPNKSFMDYLLHFVLLRRWALVSQDLLDVVQVNLNVKAPKNFVDWLCQRWHRARDFIPQDKSLKGRRVSELLCSLDSEAVEDLIDVFSQCLVSEEEQEPTIRDTSSLEDGREVADLFVIDKSGSGQDGPPSKKRRKLEETADVADTPTNSYSESNGIKSPKDPLSHSERGGVDARTKDLNGKHDQEAEDGTENFALGFVLDRTAGKRKCVEDEKEKAENRGESQEESMDVDKKTGSKPDSKDDNEDSSGEDVDMDENEESSANEEKEVESDENADDDEENSNDENEDDGYEIADRDKENDNVEIVASNGEGDNNVDSGDEDDGDDSADSSEDDNSNETDENEEDDDEDRGGNENVDFDDEDDADDNEEKEIEDDRSSDDSGGDDESDKNDDGDNGEATEGKKKGNHDKAVTAINSPTKPATKFPVCEKDPALSYFVNLRSKNDKKSEAAEIQVISGEEGSPSKDTSGDAGKRKSQRLRSESESSQGKKAAKVWPEKPSLDQKKKVHTLQEIKESSPVGSLKNKGPNALTSNGNLQLESANETVRGNTEKGGAVTEDQVGLMLSQIRSSLNDDTSKNLSVPVSTRHSTRLRTKSESSDIQMEVKPETKARSGRRQTLTGIKLQPETSVNTSDTSGSAGMLAEWLRKSPLKAKEAERQKSPQKLTQEQNQSALYSSSENEITFKKTPKTYTGSSRKSVGSPKRILIESKTEKTPTQDKSPQKLSKAVSSPSKEDTELNKVSSSVGTKTPKSLNRNATPKIDVKSSSSTTGTPKSKTKKTPVQNTPTQRRKYFLRGTSPVMSPTDEKTEESTERMTTSSPTVQKVARKSPAERRKSLRSSSKQP